MHRWRLVVWTVPITLLPLSVAIGPRASSAAEGRWLAAPARAALDPSPGGGLFTRNASASTNVPPRFAGAYRQLSERLDQFDSYLGSRGGRRRADVVFGGEVLPANSHRGEGLLTADALQGCLTYVDRLKALGAGGVSIQMAYPILNDGYPRSAEYWNFYKQLAQEIKRRGLKLHVKNGPIFTEKAFSNVATDYSKVTVDDYFRDRGKIAKRIAADIKPDYLSIGNEPSSEMQIFKFKITSDRYLQFIRETLRGMDRSKTLVGAGSGTWDAPDYIEKFAKDTDLDFIDLHIYPIASRRADYLRRAVDMAEIARAAHKRLIIGEAWLYKAAPDELATNPTAPKIFARDVFSFWAPLDIKFLEELAKLARAEGVEYASPFWTKYFFAYIDFAGLAKIAGPKDLIAAADRAMLKQLTTGNYSQTGMAYRQITGAH